MNQNNGGEHLLEHVSVPKGVLRMLMHLVERYRADSTLGNNFMLDLDELTGKTTLGWHVESEGAHTRLILRWTHQENEPSGVVEL